MEDLGKVVDYLQKQGGKERVEGSKELRKDFFILFLVWLSLILFCISGTLEQYGTIRSPRGFLLFLF